jgi:Tol biopolymer transport system component
MVRRPRRSLPSLLALACLAFLASAGALDAATEPVSRAPDGTAADGTSATPSLSHDGRFVAFTSSATNLVPDDSNELPDVFVHDLRTRRTERVSVASSGAQANGASGEPSISADGRFVAFSSAATNLVPNDTNGADDVFVHDRETGTTELVSVAEGGVQADGASGEGAISGDGRVVAFVSLARTLDEGHEGGVYLRDREAGTTRWIADGARPAINADGSVVAFVSGGAIHVFDRTTGATERVSVTTGGASANGDSDWPALSGDGRTVAFHSLATNLVADAHAGWDVFVHDRDSGVTELASVTSSGSPADDFSFFPRLSDDGLVVVFTSIAGNLDGAEDAGAWSLFLHDRSRRTTRRLPLTAGVVGDTFDHALSGDGRYVAFASMAEDLHATVDFDDGLWGVYVHGPVRP